MSHYLRRKQDRKITLGTTKEVALLIFIAEQKGLFHDQNLQLEIKVAPYMRKSMEWMIEGKVNCSALVETNVAYLGYLKPKIPIKCFASLGKTSTDNVVFRHKNAQPEDMAGKRVGFMPRTTSHSFLMHFLDHYNIDSKSITLKPFTPQVLPDALIRGDVDAISVWQPHADNTVRAMRELSIPYTHIKNTGFYNTELVLGAPKPFLITQREKCKRLLGALKEAETFIQNSPDEALSIMASRIKDKRYKDMKYPFPKLGLIDSEYIENIKFLGNRIREEDTQFIGKDLPDYNDFIDTELFLETFPENR